MENFPPLEAASKEGLLAIGGDLSESRLLMAYRNGIFPWYGMGDPILWWSPDPRCVIFPAKFKRSRSLNKAMKKQSFHFTLDTAFTRVITECAAPRKSLRDGLCGNLSGNLSDDLHDHSQNTSPSNAQNDSPTDAADTWITADMARAYIGLHRSGFAHSAEIWQRDQLVGGLYGIAIGGVFFGESMFSRVPDSSKAALALLIEQLVQWDFRLIDCQVSSAHLLTLGAEEIPRANFITHSQTAQALPGKPGLWSTAPAA